MKKKLIVGFVIILILVLGGIVTASVIHKERQEVSKNEAENIVKDNNIEQNDNNETAENALEPKEEKQNTEENKDNETTNVDKSINNEVQKKQEDKTNVKTESKQIENTNTNNKQTERNNNSQNVTSTKKPEVVQSTTNTQREQKNEAQKTEEKLKCTGDKHFMDVGNSKKWFNTEDEAIAYYNKIIKEWGTKWENFEIDDATYNKNCPYGYEDWSCICGKWTINFYYR